MRKNIFGFSPNVFFTGLTSLLTDTSTKMVYSVMSLFLLSLGASKTTIALIEGVAESTASLLKILSGYSSDKIGKNKPFMILGYGITALVTPFYAFVATPMQILWLRFLERIGKGVRNAPRDSLITASIDPSETGKAFGLHKAMDNSGAILGPLIAFGILSVFPLDYGMVFLVATIPAILGVITIILFIREVKISPQKSAPMKTSFSALPRRFYLFLGIIFLFTLGNSADALLLVRTTETGIDSTYIPFVYMIFHVVSVAFAIPLGGLSDRIGREKLLILGFALFAIVYFAFGYFQTIGIFILLFILYGFYSALTDGTQKAMVSDIVGKEVKGTGFGLYYAILGITLLPANLIAGWLYDHMSSSSPFYFGSSMAFLAMIAMMFYSGKYSGKREG